MSDPIDMEADKTKEKMTMATIIKQTKEEINWAEIATEPENMVRVEVPKLIASTEIMAEDIMERQEETPLLASAESFRIFCEHLEKATRAVADAWEAIKGAAEFQKAMRWAEADNRPLAARYHRAKKKRIRKKYAKRILAWYREEIL